MDIRDFLLVNSSEDQYVRLVKNYEVDVNKCVPFLWLRPPTYRSRINSYPAVVTSYVGAWAGNDQDNLTNDYPSLPIIGMVHKDDLSADLIEEMTDITPYLTKIHRDNTAFEIVHDAFIQYITSLVGVSGKFLRHEDALTAGLSEQEIQEYTQANYMGRQEYKKASRPTRQVAGALFQLYGTPAAAARCHPRTSSLSFYVSSSEDMSVMQAVAADLTLIAQKFTVENPDPDYKINLYTADRIEDARRLLDVLIAHRNTKDVHVLINKLGFALDMETVVSPQEAGPDSLEFRVQAIRSKLWPIATGLTAKSMPVHLGGVRFFIEEDETGNANDDDSISIDKGEKESVSDDDSISVQQDKVGLTQFQQIVRDLLSLRRLLVSYTSSIDIEDVPREWVKVFASPGGVQSFIKPTAIIEYSTDDLNVIIHNLDLYTFVTGPKLIVMQVANNILLHPKDFTTKEASSFNEFIMDRVAPAHKALVDKITAFLNEQPSYIQSSSAKRRKISCAVCGEDASFVCSGCSNANYCSGECQAKDWTEGHGTTCKRKRADWTVEPFQWTVEGDEDFQKFVANPDKFVITDEDYKTDEDEEDSDASLGEIKEFYDMVNVLEWEFTVTGGGVEAVARLSGWYDGSIIIESFEVRPEDMQGMGIGTAVIEYIKEQTGKSLETSGMDNEAKSFWSRVL